MSEKLEQIKQLQEDLFVEEHGVTKEQARKLNEFIFTEPTGKEFNFWQGGEVPSPSVSGRLVHLKHDIEFHEKKVKELEKKYDRLVNQFWVVLALVIASIVILYFGRF